MHKETGEIREYEKVPNDVRPCWSEPFHIGQVVELFGVKLKIQRVKVMAGKIILVHVEEKDVLGI